MTDRTIIVKSQHLQTSDYLVVLLIVDDISVSLAVSIYSPLSAESVLRPECALPVYCWLVIRLSNSSFRAQAAV